MTTTVFLADLRHNYAGVLSTDCMPIGVAYMKAVMDRDLPDVASQLFAYPGAMLEAVREQRPHVIMLSNYVWNEALSLHVAKVAKRINPNTLVVMGGPNIPVEPERQIEFLRRRPAVDVYVLGEGDLLARDIVRLFGEAGHRLDAFGELTLESSVWRRADGTVQRNEMHDRGKQIEDIPSPWLTGVMDEFFDGKLAPMIETNRGCPFSCSFCVQGTKYYNRVANFDLDRLAAEIDYVGERIHRLSPQMGTLRIADANFGMYDRDSQIAGFIGQAQAKYGWPTFIDTTTGKNKAEKIIEAMEKVNGAIVLYQAVQSLDENVLRNVRRSNIKLEAYEQIGVHVRGRGLRMNSDLILGLPGETLDSHRESMRKLINAGTDQMHCFQAMMLMGSDMEKIEAREMFRFHTRFRALPKNFGEYDDERVFDVEEIIVATDTLPFEDYVKARELHVAFSVFWNDGWFREVIDFARSCGITPYDWLEAMLAAMRADTGAVRAFLDRFVAETKSELFPSREECIAFYSRDENFDRLRNAEIGDNLMYKYRAIASYFLWNEICACAMNATRDLLVAKGIDRQMPDFDGFWREFHTCVRLRHAHGATTDEVLAPVRANLDYDIPRWLADGMPLDTAAYRLGRPDEYEFSLTSEGSRELAAAFKVWTYQIKGLTKMVTRIRVGSQVRQCRPLSRTGGPARGRRPKLQHERAKSDAPREQDDQ